MSTATFLQIVGYFVAGWIIGGFIIVGPQIIKSIQERRAAKARSARFFRQ